jgi:ABC-type lipoprotein release transport system permease subunit
MILRIALRNVVRQRRRSVLTMLAIVLSFALLIVLTGIADGAHEQMAEIGVRMGLGDVVVYADGYRDDPSLDRLVRDPDRVKTAAEVLGADTEGVALRLETDGLTQAGSSAVGTLVWGVDPAVEGRLSKVGAPASIIDGHPLDAGDVNPSPGWPPPIVLGRDLAENLGARVGDRVTVTIQPISPRDGSTPAMRTGAFLVKGIYATGVRDVDSHVILAPLSVIQALAGAGHGVTMVAILLRHVKETPAVADALARNLAGDGLEVLPWQKAAPELYATIALDEASMYLMMIVVYIVVGAGILNTILMSVMQRTREFGVLLAVGAAPGYVVGIVLIEALVLGAASLAAGLAVGLAANHYFATSGLALKVGHVEASGVLLPSRFYADLGPEKVFVSTVVVLALVVASALYPAARAARLQPVEAIRHA